MSEHRLYVNDINHTAGLRGTAYFNCPFTHECENDQCFWKQRDCYGLCPWATAMMDPEYVELEKRIVEEHGKPYFPEWTIQVGTNCLTMYCQDTKVDGKFPNKPEPPSQSGV